jgi:myo-inositol-1(or 4)-monophosphatase
VERELQVATDAARRAGAAIRDVFERRATIAVTHKDGDKGPLTEADLASDAILADALRTAFPDDGLLSEESGDDASRLGKRRVWIVDPLDGTREFTMGLPEFVVSIGLVVDGEAVFGVLYQPIVDDLLCGIVGGGAWANGTPCRVSSRADVDGARFLVSRNEMEKGWFDRYRGRVNVEPMGSVAYKFGQVAAGRVDATFTPKPRNEWDLCGGVACLLAAGGRASDGSGAPYRFNAPDPLKHGVCGTNGNLHDAVLELMRAIG